MPSLAVSFSFQLSTPMGEAYVTMKVTYINDQSIEEVVLEISEPLKV